MFALKTGMKNNELLGELKGRIAGESRQQVQEYLHHKPASYERIDMPSSDPLREPTLFPVPCSNEKNHIENWDSMWLSKKHVTHMVIAVDGANEYAIIEVRFYERIPCDTCRISHIPMEIATPVNRPPYFLCGINSDDNLYFLHPLFEVPVELIWQAKNNGDVMSIVNWCNKHDLGFEGRIQGDILYASVEPKTKQRIVKPAHQRLYSDELTHDFKLGKYMLSFSLRLVSLDYGLDSTILSDWWLDKNTISQFRTDDLEAYPSEISIGNNHRLYTNGIITRIDRFSTLGYDIWPVEDISNNFLVLGSILVMKHPEHPTVTRQIQKGEAMLVTVQRGSLNNGLDDLFSD
jgi:hypothetical protein